MKDTVKEYPNSINPNANPSGTLAIERAKLAMSLVHENGQAARDLQAELLDQVDSIQESDQPQ